MRCCELRDCNCASCEHCARLKKLGGVAAGIAATAAAGAALYVYVIRPWHLRWQTTADEATGPMPGDDLVTDPNITLTRVITIEAPPAAVWPWLVQMGYRRAGWYSYDLFDNDNVHVHRIVPEFQDLKVGDIMRTDAEGGFRVEAIDPGRSIVAMIHGQEMRTPADIAICLILRPLDSGGQRTRLLLRLHGRFWGASGRLFGLIFDFGDFVFMRKMLLGIKQRAEAAYRSQVMA
jgi:hypothetical protein